LSEFLFDPLWWKVLLKALVLPPTGPLLLSVVGIALISRYPRLGRGSAAIGVLVLLVLSMPVVATILSRWVDSSPPLDPELAKTAQAIVILGGGTRRNAPEYGGDTLNRLTLERVRYGARVARLVGLPILVSGGSSNGGETEAKLMQESLEREFGVQVRWAEDRSRTTHENAVYSAAILRAEGVRRIVLVGHSFDIPRATAEFGRQGLEVIAAPTGIPARGSDGTLEFVPTIAGLQGSYYALYEMLANAVLMATTFR
jgi:uncharacterized SAM-binding protein YcdF (DUF218 family)